MKKLTISSLIIFLIAIYFAKSVYSEIESRRGNPIMIEEAEYDWRVPLWIPRSYIMLRVPDYLISFLVFWVLISTVSFMFLILSIFRERQY